MESADYAYSARSTRNPFRYVLAVWRVIRRDPTETTDEAAIVEMGFARSRLGRRFARWEETVASLTRHPHTAEALLSDGADPPYSREQAAYPAPWVRERKFWPAVGRIDNAYGDRNLVCTCGSVADYLA